MYIRHLLIGLSLLFNSLFAVAQSQSPLEISVTGTRNLSGQTASTPQTTQIITSQDLNEQGITTISEAIERFTGISLARNGSVGSSTAMFVRGSNSNHVVVLLDGQRLTSTTDGKTEIEYIPIELVERIEFVPGGLSTLYGSDAIGGVLQIFTRPLSSAPVQSITLGLGDGHGSGSYSNAGRFSETTSYRVSLGQEYTAGYDASNVYTDSDKDGFSKRHLDLALTHRFGKFDLTGFWGVWDGTTEFDESFPNGNNATDFTSRRIGGKLAYIGANHSFESQLSRLDNDRKNYQTSAASTSDTTVVDRTEWINTINLTLPSEVELTTGFDARNESAESTYATGKQQSRGIFAAVNKGFEAFTLEAALRREYQDDYGYQSSWSTGIVIPLSSNSDVYATRKYAYSNPTLADLDPVWGNPNLLPEEAYTNELAYRFDYNNGWKGDLVTYESNFSNLIEYSNFALSNIGNARTRGVELNLERQFDAVGIDIGVAYLDSENLDSNGSPLINRVAHKVVANADYRLSESTTVNLGYQYVGNMTSLDAVTYTAKPMPDYSLWNLSTTHEYSDSISLKFSVDNLFDKAYEPVDGFNGRGRYIAARLNYTF